MWHDSTCTDHYFSSSLCHCDVLQQKITYTMRKKIQSCRYSSSLFAAVTNKKKQKRGERCCEYVIIISPTYALASTKRDLTSFFAFIWTKIRIGCCRFSTFAFCFHPLLSFRLQSYSNNNNNNRLGTVRTEQNNDGWWW